MPTRTLPVLAAAILATLSTSAARAAEAGDQPAHSPLLRQEIAGLELMPLSVGTAGGGSLGLGATLRLGRHRWPHFFWTPVQGGLFVGGPDSERIILLKIDTEAGLVLRSDIGTIEAGLGAGWGTLSMEDRSFFCNDGSCGVGGAGIMLSPVVRFLVRERSTHTVGAFIRAAIPVGETRGDTLIYLKGFGMAFLVGLDLAAGWG